MNNEIVLRKLSPSDAEAFRDIWLEAVTSSLNKLRASHSRE
ncbi:MAG: hypothetical protein QNJ32_29395 [Xenococcaceae cyanobacterium MO_167.B27]|nr:hypothetical protein [Xenococcaceae cyanobacterium MO_167.B27]